jgi:glycosyltransferase involved in cell wall biosynthesis
MTLLEAMACGCAVIATRRGGAPEMVEHGQSGLLVEPGQVSALVEAIRSLARSDAERRRLAEAGLERVRAYFDVNRMVREHAHLYSTLGSARRRGLRGRRW